jgi:hypothetical protein
VLEIALCFCGILESAVQARPGRPDRIVVTTTIHDDNRVVLHCRTCLDDPDMLIYERAPLTGPKHDFTNRGPRLVFVFVIRETAKHHLKLETTGVHAATPSHTPLGPDTRQRHLMLMPMPPTACPLLPEPLPSQWRGVVPRQHCCWLTPVRAYLGKPSTSGVQPH